MRTALFANTFDSVLTAIADGSIATASSSCFVLMYQRPPTITAPLPNISRRSEYSMPSFGPATV